jgi:Sap, sulfolipid-1-addressing protein
VGSVFTFALLAALNPALLASTTLMLTLTSPKRLLFGYLAGAGLMAFTCGLLLVFLLPGSSTANTTKHKVNPILDITLGVLILLIVTQVARKRDQRRRAWSKRRHEKAANAPPPRWKRELSKGSARATFVVGILLTFPGASYIAGMDELHKQHIGVVATVLAVLAFDVIMLILLIVPTLGYAIRPDATQAGVDRFSNSLSRNGGRIGLIGGCAVGIILLGRGVISLL